MLSAYVNASDMDGAEKFFKRIKQDGFEPNVITHGTLINGYAKANNLEKMMEKYENMRVEGMKANATIFTSIMDAFGRNKDFGSAAIWYNEMVTAGISPDKKANNILLSLAKTEEEQLEAKQLVENLSSSLSSNSAEGDEEEDEDEDEDDGESEREVLDDEFEELIISSNDEMQHAVLEEAHALWNFSWFWFIFQFLTIIIMQIGLTHRIRTNIVRGSILKQIKSV